MFLNLYVCQEAGDKSDSLCPTSSVTDITMHVLAVSYKIIYERNLVVKAYQLSSQQFASFA